MVNHLKGDSIEQSAELLCAIAHRDYEKDVVPALESTDRCNARDSRSQKLYLDYTAQKVEAGVEAQEAKL